MSDAYNKASNYIYNNSGGTISIGSLSSQGGKGGVAKGLVESTANYASHGAKDRDSNCFYDAHMKVQDTKAILAVVCGTSAGNQILHTYEKINWGNSNVQKHMTEMGVLKSSDQSGLLKHGFCDNNSQPVPVTSLSQSQVKELATHGYFTKPVNSTLNVQVHVNGQHKDVAMAEAQKILRNPGFDAAVKGARTPAEKRAQLAGIKDVQVAYLKKNSVTGKFDGSEASANREIRANKANIEALKQKLLYASAEDKVKIKGQIKDANANIEKLNTFMGNADRNINKNKANIDALKEKLAKASPADKAKIEKEIAKAKDNITKLNMFKLTNGHDIDIEKTRIDSLKKKLGTLSPAERIKVNEEIAKAKDNIEKLNLFKQTGAKSVANTGENLKARGRGILIRNAVGNDFYKGITFYKTGARLIKSSAKISIKAPVKITHSAVKLGTGATRVVTWAPKKAGSVRARNISDRAKKIGEGSDKINSKVNSRLQKKTKEQKAANKTNKRLEKREKQDNKFTKKQNKTDAKISKEKAKGIENNKKTRKLEKKKNRRDGRHNLRGKGRGISDKFRVMKGKLGKVFGAPKRALHKIKDIAFAPLKLLKGAIIKVLLICVGGFLVIEIGGLIIILIIGALQNFFGGMPCAQLANELNEINYVQFVVNDTANTLGKSLTNTMLNDASNYFYKDTNRKSSTNYDWTVSIDNATLNNIWAIEDADNVNNGSYAKSDVNLKGVSANMVAICSLMHYRFGEEITFDNYLTAEGYMYWMYVRSHTVDNPGDGKPYYNYTMLANCKDEDVVTGSMSYNPDTHVVTRSTPVCTNVYIHGYTSSYNQTINEKRAAMVSFTSRVPQLVSALKNISNTAGEANGVFLGRKPSDSKGECDNYETFRGDLVCGLEEHNHVTSGCTQSWYDGDTKCTKEEHVHSVANGCYELTLVSESDNCPYGGTHEEVDESDWNRDHPDDIRESCYEYVKVPATVTIGYTCGYAVYNVPYDDYINGKYDNCGGGCDDPYEESPSGISSVKVTAEKDEKRQTCNGHHEHGEECKKYEYTLTCTKEEHSHSGSGETLKWDCGKENHVHSPWQSESDQGCFNTAYVCKGHCGGHMDVSTDIWMNMSLKELMKMDSFKVAYFLSSDDFDASYKTMVFKDFDAWQDYWMKKSTRWFFPWPNSAKDFYEWGAHKMTNIAASFGNWIQGNGWNSPGTKNIDASDDKDKFQFDGWLTKVGTDPNNSQYGIWQIKQDVYNEVKDMYGDWDTHYKNGLEMFADFEVEFPGGFNSTLTNDNKEAVISKIQSTGVSDERLKVISTAMDRTGEFYFSTSLSCYSNPITNKSGSANSTSFITGVLLSSKEMEADVPGFNNKVAVDVRFDDLVAMASDCSSSSFTAGDAIINPSKKAAAIYVGYIPANTLKAYKVIRSSDVDAVSQMNAGTYIIECSEKYGGSVLRQIQSSELSHYTKRITPDSY